MNRIIFTEDILAYMSIFSSATHVQPRDCIIDETGLLFIIPPGLMGRAIGPGGQGIRRVEHALKKRVRVVEYQEDALHFISGLAGPARIKDIRQDSETVIITAIDSQARGAMIGRAGSNLRRMESIAKRYFPITEIRIK